jgi:DNA repair protein RecO (recombination protein O)
MKRPRPPLGGGVPPNRFFPHFCPARAFTPADRTPPMITRTDAVVLRALDYGETSQIVTLYTRQHGRVSVMARGSRRPKSRFGSTLQPMSYVQAVYYHKAGRDLQTLKEASHVHLLRSLSADVAKLTAGYRMVELVRALTEQEDPSPTLFALLLHALLRLDEAGENAANVLPHFQLRMAAVLGFAPDVRKEDVVALPEGGGVLALDSGGILPAGAAHKAGVRASRSALRAFAVFARADLDTALRMRLSADQHAEVLRAVDAYLRHHIEGRYPTRVSEVTRQLTAPGAL